LEVTLSLIDCVEFIDVSISKSAENDTENDNDC